MLVFLHTVLWLLMKSFDLFTVSFMSAASKAFLNAKSAEIYKWIRIKGSKEVLYVSERCKATVRTQHWTIISDKWKMHIHSPNWCVCLLLFLWALTQAEVQFWRNLFYLYASETGRASLRHRVPVWTFVSAVHLQTRLVLAETVKSLEQTPSAHYFSIHSDLLSLAFVSDVRRKHVKALKPGSYIWTLHWVLLIVITVQDSTEWNLWERR